ncbi:MAG: NUDIX domain-containing protein [Bacteroidales bacterium]|nr:NUDIX domain-containing protein [Bacteroidales bacterium]MBP5213809.1 NUDIX domain-containing protein [Bacteroidales bacterium]MBP5763976.1 NUDIX domain-containing protein [Bacteroidales bacterium]
MKPDNPLYRFRFCPICGSSRFEVHAENARRCADCGFTYYTNPRGATVAVILNDADELLVGIRANQPAIGTFDLVGGFADLDETIEQAMCREIREESGLEVQPSQLRYLFSVPNTYPFSGICIKTIDFFFEVRLSGRPALKGMDDISRLRWVPLREVDPAGFGLNSVRQGLERYLELTVDN